MQRRWFFLAPMILAGCAASTPEEAATPAEVAAPPVDVGARPELPKIAVEAPSALPTECAEKDEKVCLPPEGFVKKLCKNPYPEVALAMFAKATPWTRGYLRGNVQAWNASGGRSTSDQLVFDEEVLVLHRRVAAASAMKVSGASGGGYDVLRWDGSCASLAGEEITFKIPPKGKSAKIPYRLLDPSIRTALEANEKIGKAMDDRRRECQSGAMGDVTPSCAKADDLANGAIVDYVRSGGSLPAPTRLP